MSKTGIATTANTVVGDVLASTIWTGIAWVVVGIDGVKVTLSDLAGKKLEGYLDIGSLLHDAPAPAPAAPAKAPKGTVTYKGKAWDKAAMQAAIADADAAKLLRMLGAIYARQTADEKADGGTKHSNGRGFSGTDASFLSDVYRRAVKHPNGLSEKQAACVRKNLHKYAGQLVEALAEKAAAEAPVEAA